MRPDRIDDRLDESYFEGRSVDEASMLISAANHAVPELRRAGGRQRLPRADRALQSWRTAAPPKQRVPLPWLAVAAMICCTTSVLRMPRLAAKWLVAFDTYLRPGEMIGLRIRQLVPPCSLLTEGTYGLRSILIHPATANKPGKTGLLDEAVLMDDVSLEPFLDWLTAGQPLDRKVWEHSVAAEVAIFAQTAAALGLVGASTSMPKHVQP